MNLKIYRDIIEVEELPPTATPTPLKNEQCNLEKRPTPARTNQDPPCNMILKNKAKQSKPNPPSPLHQKPPAWKVELSKTMKKKKIEKSLQTSKKVDGVQAARFKSFFTSKEVKMTNFYEKTDFKSKCPPIQKGAAEKPNTSKISKVGSLCKFFEKKVPGNPDQ